MRYPVAGVKSRCTVPAAPAGSTQACCQPSTVRASSRCPARVARHPALTFCGTTSSVAPARSPTATCRCSAPPVTEAVVRAAAAGRLPSRVRVTVAARKASVPVRTSRWAPASMSRACCGPQGAACTGRRAIRSATVVVTVNAWGRPSTVSTGPASHGTTTGAAGSTVCSPGTATSLTPTPSGDVVRV